MRKIATGLYTQAAMDCLDSVLGQLSDGRWHHMPSMAKYWCYAVVSRDADGQVSINISEERFVWHGYGNGFLEMNDFKVMNFFANKIKQIVKEEFKHSHESNLIWDRSCKHVSNYLTRGRKNHPNIEVRDAYLVYEILKGRSRAKSKYSCDVLTKVLGHPLTPEMIEALKKIKKLQTKRDDELNTAKFNYDKTCAVIKSKYEEQISELKKIAG